MLCKRCETLFWQLKHTRKGTGWSLYRRAARRVNIESHQECKACKFFNRTIQHFGYSGIEMSWARFNSANYVIESNVYDCRDPENKISNIYHQVVEVGPRYGLDRLQFGINGQTTNTGSDACLSLARYWIQHCQKTHYRCKLYGSTTRQGWNPTRLVFIGKEGAKPRLCEVGSIGAPVQYATLSHCWGKKSNTTQLQLANKAAFQETLPNLPRTFRDAITAAKALGLDYIWIDSLCIIQDDTPDREKEISLMGKVYEFSTVTITATSSEDHDGGCFFDRSTHDTFPTRISLGQKYSRNRRQNVQGSIRGSELIRTSQVRFDLDFLAEDRWEEDVVNAPVNKRGWVLQERFLSQRLLHFSKRQLYWECNQMLASESYPGGFFRYRTEQYQVSSPWLGRLRSTVPLGTSDVSEQHQQPLPLYLHGLFREVVIKTWMDVIEDYTRRDLTKQTDKLPAISALAQKVHDYRECHYLAGIWKDDLVYELGWIPDECQPSCEETEDDSAEQSKSGIHCGDFSVSQPVYRAPSWSWASVDGSVTYVKEINRPGINYSMIEYVDHRIELRESANPYGQVKGGFLTIKAQTIMITVTDDYPGPSPTTQMRISVNGHTITSEFRVYQDDFVWGPFSREPHNTLAMPLLVSLCPSGQLSLNCILLEERNNSHKRIGMLDLKAQRCDLESDCGLREFICQIGTVEWDSKPCPKLERDVSQLQQITIV